MRYKEGQVVCLWKVVFDPKRANTTVEEEVLVTVASVVKDEHVCCVEGQGDDGKTYRKIRPLDWHMGPAGSWFRKNELELGTTHTGPPTSFEEATYFWLALKLFNMKEGKNLVWVDLDGKPIVPKGDVAYCAKRDVYVLC